MLVLNYEWFLTIEDMENALIEMGVHSLFFDIQLQNPGTVAVYVPKMWIEDVQESFKNRMTIGTKLEVYPNIYEREYEAKNCENM